MKYCWSVPVIIIAGGLTCYLCQGSCAVTADKSRVKVDHHNATILRL